MHRSRLFGGIFLLVVLLSLSGCRPSQDEGTGDPPKEANNDGGETSVLPMTPAEPADWELDPESPSATAVDLEPWTGTASGVPEDCIFFAASIGQPQKDAESEWPAERFLATPSVGVFFDRVQNVLLADAYKKLGNPSPETSEEERRLIELFEILIERPAAVYVTETAPVPTEQESLLLWKRAGLIVDLGEHTDRATASLEDLLNILYEDIVEEGVSNDLQGYTIRTANNIFAFACVHEGRLLIAVGENELEQLLARLDEAIVPEFVGNTLSESDIPKPLTVAHINVGAIIESPEHLEMFVSAYALPDFNFGTSLAGVRDTESVSHVTGLGSLGLRTKTVLKTNGENGGVIDNVFTEHLTVDDLRRVPADAAIVVAVKGDASGVQQAVREGASAVFPDDEDAAAALFSELAGQWSSELFSPMQDGTGIDIKELLPSLGSAWIAYGTLPIDGPGLIPEFLLYNELMAPEQFASSFDRISRYLCETPDQGNGRPSFTTRRISGKELLNISLPIEGSPIPLAIIAGIVDECFVVSTNQRAIEAFLARNTDTPTSFADNPFAIEALVGPAPAAVLTYIETASVFELFYPILPTTPMIARIMYPPIMEHPAMQIWAGIAPALPPEDDIAEYMTPISFSASRTNSGVEVIGYYPLPGGTAAIRRSPPMILPMRVAADQMQSINNLKWIGLGVHNYYDTYRHFPPAYTSDSSSEQPLLSWRVHILPYIDEASLYEEFHLNEPWDSPHNATLIERMPDVYRSPYTTAEPGKTRYQAVRIEGSPFGENTADVNLGRFTTFSSIIDGTANTIMTVETDDERAVAWTQPGDFVPSPDDLMDGLHLDAQGRITAGFCDGAIQRLRSDIPDDVFLNLLRMQDRNPINWDVIR
jgi:hypothetical protein